MQDDIARDNAEAPPQPQVNAQPPVQVLENTIRNDHAQLTQQYNQAAGREFEIIKKIEGLKNQIGDLEREQMNVEKQREISAYKIGALENYLNG